VLVAGCLVISGATAVPAAAESSSASRKGDKLSQGAFRPDPNYDPDYNAQGQLDIYGAKSVVEPPRPPLELGRQQYTSGLYDESNTLLGKLNPLLPGLDRKSVV